MSYDPGNHERMTKARAEKVANTKNIPELELDAGEANGKLLILGWGSTYGALRPQLRTCVPKEWTFLTHR